MNVNTIANRRKFKRIKIHNLSRVDNKNCEIINASRDGLLLAANEPQPSNDVEIQMKINGKWVNFNANVIWSIKNPTSAMTSMGVYVTDAPTEYTELINNLYLEADEKPDLDFQD